MKNFKAFGFVLAVLGTLTFGGTLASADSSEGHIIDDGVITMPAQVPEPVLGQMTTTDTYGYAKIMDNYRSFDLMTTTSNKTDGTKTTSWQSAGFSDQPGGNFVRVRKEANNGSRYSWYQISKVGVATKTYWVSGQALTEPTGFFKALTAKNTTSKTSLDNPALTTDIAFTIEKAIPVYSVDGKDLKTTTTNDQNVGYQITKDQLVKTTAGQILYPIGNGQYINSADVFGTHVTLL